MTKPSAAPPTGRLIGGMFRRQRRDTALCAGFWSLHQVCEALVPVAIGLVIDQAVGTGSTTAMLWSVLGIFALFLALTMGWRFGFWFLSKAVVRESHDLRMQVVRRVLTGRGIRTNRQNGELLSIATSDTQAAAELLELGSRMVSALVGLTVATVVLLRIDWSLGLGLVVGVPLLVLGLNALGPVVERHTSAQQQAIGRAAATASDLLRGLRPLRGFGWGRRGCPSLPGGQPHLAAGQHRGGASGRHLRRCVDVHHRSAGHGGRRAGRLVRPTGADHRR